VQSSSCALARFPWGEGRRASPARTRRSRQHNHTRPTTCSRGCGCEDIRGRWRHNQATGELYHVAWLTEDSDTASDHLLTQVRGVEGRSYRGAIWPQRPATRPRPAAPESGAAHLHGDDDVKRRRSHLSEGEWRCTPMGYVLSRPLRKAKNGVRPSGSCQTQQEG